MSIHKFGYRAESLQKDKLENLEKELESQTKLINIKLNDLPNKTFKNVQQLTFDNGDTKVLTNANVYVCRQEQNYRR